jgi:hypothetical protein
LYIGSSCYPPTQPLHHHHFKLLDPPALNITIHFTLPATQYTALLETLIQIAKMSRRSSSARGPYMSGGLGRASAYIDERTQSDRQNLHVYDMPAGYVNPRLQQQQQQQRQLVPYRRPSIPYQPSPQPRRPSLYQGGARRGSGLQQVRFANSPAIKKYSANGSGLAFGKAYFKDKDFR